MTPEEIRLEKMRRKRLARIRFRSLVRTVMLNSQWLQEMEEQRLGDNVRRNVAIIIRRKGKKGLLTIKEKAILMKEPIDRTIPERRIITSILASLKCFSRYSPKVRSRLARITHFMYFGPGRTIVKEGHMAEALYFILDGDIHVSQKQYDPVTRTYVETIIGGLGPGDMFGEVALLDHIPRIATCRTATDVELLCVYSSDFDKILRGTLQLQWEQMHLALESFEYFQNWTQSQLRECCILGRIKEYNPLQTIYCEDKGVLNFVHFVISGQCVILQCLKMKTKLVKNKKNFKLSNVNTKAMSSDVIMEKINRVAEDLYIKRQSFQKDEDLEKLHDIEDGVFERILIEDTSDESSFTKELQDDKNIQYSFVNVGTLRAGAVFGLGERMEHRSIFAKNTVQCLLIPRYWLFQKNQNLGNIWKRTEMFLNATIPSREVLFEDFLATEKWKKYKKSVINDIVKFKTNTNPTKVDDIPIICRIIEN